MACHQCQTCNRGVAWLGCAARPAGAQLLTSAVHLHGLPVAAEFPGTSPRAASVWFSPGLPEQLLSTSAGAAWVSGLLWAGVDPRAGWLWEERAE